LFESGCFILLGRFRRGGIWGRSIMRGLTGPAAGLRLPPFQVFTQRVAQPVLASDRAVIRALIWLVGHGVLCWNGFANIDPMMSHPGETMMTDTYALAPLPQQTLAGWHRFVTTGKADVLAPLLAEAIVFHSPFVQSPIPGRAATLLVLTTVVQIFENFRYHRAFIGGPHDAALEFSANIGQWRLKGIDLIQFNAEGEMTEFEVMIRPIKALQALGEEMGNRIGPQLALLKQAASAPR
jgi:hypothetical protein